MDEEPKDVNKVEMAVCRDDSEEHSNKIKPAHAKHLLRGSENRTKTNEVNDKITL